MPGLNGLDLQRRLQLRGSGEQIVFITGSGDVPSCARAMKGSAVDFLTKPFDPEELIAAVARTLVRANECLQLRTETARRGD